MLLFLSTNKTGKPSPPQWMDSMLKDHGIHFLTSRFEGGGLLAQPTLRDLTGPFSVRATLQWMDLLLAALDCYNTFISLHIIKPQHMLSKPEIDFLKAMVLKVGGADLVQVRLI